MASKVFDYMEGKLLHKKLNIIFSIPLYKGKPVFEEASNDKSKKQVGE